MPLSQIFERVIRLYENRDVETATGEVRRYLQSMVERHSDPEAARLEEVGLKMMFESAAGRARGTEFGVFLDEVMRSIWETGA